MATKKEPAPLSDELLASLRTAADAEQEVRDDPPDEVVVEGVTYYRRKPAEGPPQSLKKDDKGTPYEFITVNLAPHSAEIRIDAVRYLQGFTYEVPAAKAASMREIMFRSWQHERATGGANINAGGRGMFGSTAVLNAATGHVGGML